MTTTNLDIGVLDDLDGLGVKKAPAIPCVVSMEQSFTGSVLLGLDQMGKAPIDEIWLNPQTVLKLSKNIVLEMH